MKIEENGTDCLPSNFFSYYDDYMRQEDWELANLYGTFEIFQTFNLQVLRLDYLLVLGRQWQYLTCTQLGFHQTANNPNTMFGARLPLSFFLKACEFMFG